MPAFDGFSDGVSGSTLTSGLSASAGSGLSAGVGAGGPPIRRTPPSWLTEPVAGFEDVWAKSPAGVSDGSTADGSSVGGLVPTEVDVAASDADVVLVGEDVALADADAVAHDSDDVADVVLSDEDVASEAYLQPISGSVGSDTVDVIATNATVSPHVDLDGDFASEADAVEPATERASRGMSDLSPEDGADAPALRAVEPGLQAPHGAPGAAPEAHLSAAEVVDARQILSPAILALDESYESIPDRGASSGEGSAVESGFETASESGTDSMTGPVAEPDLEYGTGSLAEPESQPETESEHGSESESGAESEPQSGLEPAAESEHGLGSEHGLESEQGLDSGSGSGVDRDLDLELLLDPDFDLTSELDATVAPVPESLLEETADGSAKGTESESEPESGSELDATDATEPGPELQDSSEPDEAESQPEADEVEGQSEPDVVTGAIVGVESSPEEAGSEELSPEDGVDVSPTSDKSESNESDFESEQASADADSPSDLETSGAEDLEGAADMPDNSDVDGDKPFVSPADEWASLLGQDAATGTGIGEVYRPAEAPNRSVFGLTFVPDQESVVEQEAEVEEDEDESGGVLKPIVALLVLAVVVALLFVFRAPLMGLLFGGDDDPVPPGTPSTSSSTQGTDPWSASSSASPSSTASRTPVPTGPSSAPPSSVPPSSAPPSSLQPSSSRPPSSAATSSSTTTTTTTTTTRPPTSTTASSVWPPAASVLCAVDVRTNSAAHCTLANAIASQVSRTLALEETQQVRATDSADSDKAYSGVCVKHPTIIQCSLAATDVQVFILPA